MKWLRYALIGISLMLFVLITVVQSFAYNEDYYLAEYEKYGIYENTDLDASGVLLATEGIIAYLKGEREDLDLEYHGLEIFNNREKDHMADVRTIFDVLQKVKLTAALLLILLVVTGRNMRNVLVGTWVAAGLSLAMLGSLLLAMATDFTGAFIRFHELLFSNELWILDPRTDRLIQMLPEGFFIDMGTIIVITHLSIILTLALVALFNRKRVKQTSAVGR